MAAGSNLRKNFLEAAFILQMHLGMSYSDIRSLPLSYRRWFVDRLVKHFKEKNKNNNNTNNSQVIEKSESEKSVELKKIEKIFKKFS